MSSDIQPPKTPFWAGLADKARYWLPRLPINQESPETPKQPLPYGLKSMPKVPEHDAYWVDRDGNKIHEKNIRPYEKLREEAVRGFAAEWKALNRQLALLKRRSFAGVESLIATCALEYNVTLAGKKKGACSLPTYDGSLMLQRRYNDRMRYDERIMVAESLVTERS